MRLALLLWRPSIRSVFSNAALIEVLGTLLASEQPIENTFVSSRWSELFLLLGSWLCCENSSSKTWCNHLLLGFYRGCVSGNSSWQRPAIAAIADAVVAFLRLHELGVLGTRDRRLAAGAAFGSMAHGVIIFEGTELGGLFLAETFKPESVVAVVI